MSGVVEKLAPNARQYNFFQLVRLLEQYQRQDPNLRLRFRPAASLAFQPSEVTALEASANDSEALTIETALIGLYGPSSPLPLYYTEDVLDDSPEAEVLRDLLDIFNHRAHELLQAVWTKYRLPLRMHPDGSDPTTTQIAALARLGRHNGYPFRHVDARRLLPLTGMLSFNSGSARVIEQVLRYYFDLPQLRIVPNQLRSVPVPDDQTNAMGQQGRLGVDMVLGSEVLDCSGCFLICLEQVPLETTRRFYPDAPDYLALRELVDFLSPVPLEFSLSFEINTDTIPQLRLGDEQTQLGLGVLLGSPQEESLRVQFE